MSKFVRIALSVIGLFIFVILVNDFGVANILSNLRKIGWWFFAILAVWGVVYLFNAGAWSFVLEEKKSGIGFWRIFQICVSGFAINYITPFVNLGGEPYRVIALKDSVGLRNSVSSVILYSMLHFLSSFLFWIVTIIVVPFAVPLPHDVRIALGAVLFLSLLAAWFFYSRHKNGIFGTLMRFVRKVSFMKKVSAKLDAKEEALMSIDSKITNFYNNRKRAFYAALSLEFIARFVASLEFLFILGAVGVHISFLEAVYVNAGASLMMNIFFFVPMELGVREGGMYLILETLKVTSGVGVFVALVTRIRELVWIFIGLMLIHVKGTVHKEKEVIDLLRSQELEQQDGENRNL